MPDPIIPIVRPQQVVTLCGSTRFREAFEKANAELTMKGLIVLSVGFFHHGEGLHSTDCQSRLPAAKGLDLDRSCNCRRTSITDDQKRALDVLHLQKILLSGSIYVLNVDGYVGASTRREIAWAIALDRPIGWLDADKGRAWLEDPKNAHVLGQQIAEFTLNKLPPL